MQIKIFTEVGNQNFQINLKLNYNHSFFCNREPEVDKPILINQCFSMFILFENDLESQWISIT